MAVQANQDAERPLDSSKIFYIVPSKDADSIEDRNLYPIIVESARAHGLKLTQNKEAAAYWLIWAQASHVVGESGDNPFAGKIFGMGIFIHDGSTPVEIWDIKGSIADTPTLDPSSIFDKLFNHLGISCRGWERVHQK